MAVSYIYPMRYLNYNIFVRIVEMITKLGGINVHHFVHKFDGACNVESNLHKYAKEKFKEVLR